jgi:hypothetical protein
MSTGETQNIEIQQFWYLPFRIPIAFGFFDERPFFLL